jgi:hypothetical protein
MLSALSWRDAAAVPHMHLHVEHARSPRTAVLSAPARAPHDTQDTRETCRLPQERIGACARAAPSEIAPAAGAPEVRRWLVDAQKYGSVTAAAAAAQFVVTGSDGGAVTVWDLADGGAAALVAGWHVEGGRVAGLVPVVSESSEGGMRRLCLLVCMAECNTYSFEICV